MNVTSASPPKSRRNSQSESGSPARGGESRSDANTWLPWQFDQQSPSEINRTGLPVAKKIQGSISLRRTNSHARSSAVQTSICWTNYATLRGQSRYCLILFASSVLDEPWTCYEWIPHPFPRIDLKHIRPLPQTRSIETSFARCLSETPAYAQQLSRSIT